MARKISSRIQVKGDLIAQSPIYVGGMGSEPDVDMALAVDGQGRFYIPGTSLAGALRGWLEDDELWGLRLKKGDDDKGHASFIVVDDGMIFGKVFEIRDGVGIDRVYGSASEGVKYNRAVLPKGTKIEFQLTLDLKDSTSEQKDRLGALIESLEEGKIRLGAAKTRGLGKVKLVNKSIVQYDFNSRDAILRTLRGQGSAPTFQTTPISTYHKTYPELSITIHWKPIGPLMVKAEGEGIAVDSLPLTSTVENGLAFVLPGSSIKGSLRSQAERIIRTVKALEVSNNPNPRQRFIEQLEQVPLVQEVFGAAAKTKRKDQLGQMGALAVDDCYAQPPSTLGQQIDLKKWQDIESATNESELRAALNATHLDKTQQAFHVAIDRWTGGAAKNFLYTTLELMDIQWNPIELTLRKTPRLQGKTAIGTALLLMVLRDMAAGRIPLGYATNRGMGSVQVDKVILRGQDFLGDLVNFKQEIVLSQNDFVNLDISDLGKHNLLGTLNEAWKKWINSTSTGAQE